MTAIGRDLITLLASNKYQEGYIIMPYVITGVLLYQAHFIYGAGFYLRKRPTTLLILNICGVLLNVILNIILIPSLGISGAAITTLISYLLMAVLIMKLSFNYIKIQIKLGDIVKFTAASISMFLIIKNFNFATGVPFLLIKIVIAIVFYFVVILLIDADTRKILFNIIHQQFFSGESIQKI